VGANYQHLRAFHVIATEGSISRAARRLNVSQPTLSQQLKALEERHRATFFDGRKPPLRLTAMGEQLFGLTQKLFATSQDIDNLLRDPAELVATEWRLGSDSPFFAARLAAAVRSRMPSSVVRVRIGNAVETFSWLKDGQIDVAIVSDPPIHNAFAYEPLFSDKLVAAVPKSHLLAAEPVFRLSSLENECLLIREPSSRTRTVVEELLMAENVTPSDVMMLHTRDTICEGIAIGLGVGFFFSLECRPDERIRILPLDADVNMSRLTGYVVYPAEKRRSPLMCSVLEATAELRAISPRPVPMSRTGAAERPSGGRVLEGVA
jgi:DNA-binding transcriptional LysR family regulator